MNLLRYIDIQPAYKKFVTTDIMLAKQGCRRCHGRGHVGYNVARQVHIPCGCIMVDMDKLAEVMKLAAERGEKLLEKAREIPTNIPSLIDQPQVVDTLHRGGPAEIIKPIHTGGEAEILPVEAPSGNES